MLQRKIIILFLVGLYAQISTTIPIPRGVESFSPSSVSEVVPTSLHKRSSLVLSASDNDTTDGEIDKASSLSNYKDSDGASKGIVGSLTGIVNKVSAARDRNEPPINAASSLSTPDSIPKSPEELLERIRKDYEERNYLWTGDLDLDCFFKDCVFTDPTISFVGTDKFTENTQNLVPIVETFAEDYRSELLSIELGSGIRASLNNKNVLEGSDADGFYVETRWNMVGSLTASPWFFWKPKIDVIGRTKFWFRKEDPSEGDDSASSNGGGYRVYFYDESWEIAAWKALLQIVTPAGTFPSTSST
jgi:hypothetical protein